MDFLSMTGYGRVEKEYDEYSLCCEIKSINSRFLDLSLKLPQEIRYLEPELHSLFLSSLSRGKVEVWISIRKTPKKVESNLDEKLLRSAWNVWEEAFAELGIEITDRESLLRAMLRSKDFFLEKRLEDTICIATDIKECVCEALSELLKMRREEGAELKNQFCREILAMKKGICEIEKLIVEGDSQRVNDLRKQISAMSIDVDIDEARILQEVVILAEKQSVAEEKTRLDSHLRQLEMMIEVERNPIGRKIEFLLQEIHREVNTLGVKCQNVEISKLVLDLKVSIERMKEQSANIE